MTAPAPNRGGCFGRSILTVVIVLVIACLVCGVGAYVILGPAISKAVNIVADIAVPLTTSQEFMTAVTAKDYAKAYSMVHPSQQASFGGSADGMKQLFESQSMEPSTFALTNVQVGGDAIVNGTGTFGGASKYVYISLRKDGDTWKILGVNINDNPPTATPAS